MFNVAVRPICRLWRLMLHVSPIYIACQKLASVCLIKSCCKLASKNIPYWEVNLSVSSMYLIVCLVSDLRAVFLFSFLLFPLFFVVDLFVCQIFRIIADNAPPFLHLPRIRMSNRLFYESGEDICSMNNVPSTISLSMLDVFDFWCCDRVWFLSRYGVFVYIAELSGVFISCSPFFHPFFVCFFLYLLILRRFHGSESWSSPRG